MEALLEAVGVWKSYGGRPVLRGATVRVGSSSIVGLLGPNGAGKTTLIRVSLGLARRDRGEVRLLGRDPYWEPAARERVGVVFERPVLPPTLPVRLFLERAARVYGVPQGRVSEAIRLAGLSGHEWKPFSSLSAGLKQRAAIAHALLPEPVLLVADEPTSNLDPVERVRLLDLLARLRRDEGVSILVSSHVLAEVLRLADEIVVLSGGRVAARGRPEEVLLGSRPVARVRAGDPAGLASLLESRGFRVDADGVYVKVYLGGLGEAARLLDALAEAAKEGHMVYGFDLVEPGLEEVLLEVAGGG